MWRLADETGIWEALDLQFRVDLRRPDLGMSDVSVQGHDVADSLLQICLPATEPSGEELLECYVRQSDLIATYAQTSGRTVRPQIYWRVLRDGSRWGVELLLSVQTSLLESQPQTCIRNTLGGAQSLAVGDQSAEPLQGDSSYDRPVTFLHRLRDSQVSFVTAVHPADFAGAEAVCQERREVVSISMFPRSLEKGVIRRGRVRGIFVPRDDDIAAARQAQAELAATAPPLTT